MPTWTLNKRKHTSIQRMITTKSKKKKKPKVHIHSFILVGQCDQCKEEASAAKK